jgi:proline-specific peptidase
MWAEINGNRLYYEVIGEGPPVITLHGGPGLGDHRGHKQHVAEVLRKEFSVIVFDQRGNGQSEGRGPFTHEQFAHDVDGLRRHLGLDKAIIMGVSYGGFIALEYAVRYPEHISALVPFDTAASGRFDEVAKENALKANLPGVDPDGLRRLFEGRTYSNEDFKQLYGALLPLYKVNYDPEEGRKRLDAITFRYETHNACFSENLPKYNLVPELGNIRVPTWVAVGRHDWITPVEASQEVARGIPDAELTIFENSGHGPHMEERDAFFTAFRAFVTRRAR